MKTNLEKLASTFFLIKTADRAVPFDRWDNPFSGGRFIPNPNYQPLSSGSNSQLPLSGSNRLGPLSFVPENRANLIPQQSAPANNTNLNRVSIPKSPFVASSGAVPNNPNNAAEQIKNRLARLRFQRALQNTQGSQPTQQGPIRTVRPAPSNAPAAAAPAAAGTAAPAAAGTAAADAAQAAPKAVPSAQAAAAGAAEATGGVATKATAQSGRLANLLSKLAPVKNVITGVGRFAGRAMPVAGAGLGAYAAWQNLKGMADQFSQGNLLKGLGQGGAALLNAGAGAASIIPGVGWLPALALAAGGTGLDALSKGASFVKRAGIIDSLEKAKDSAGRKGEEAIDTLARSSALRRGDEALNTLSQIEQNKQISPSKLLTTLALLSAAPTVIGAGSGALIGSLNPNDSALAGARRGAYTGAGLTLGGLAGTTLVRSLLPEKLKDSELANLSAVLLPAAAGGLAGNIMARRRNRKEQEYKAMRQALAAAGYRVT
jgi:hypothetical protein